MHSICRVTSFEQGVLEVTGRQRHSKGLHQELPARMMLLNINIKDVFYEENEKVTVGTLEQTSNWCFKK
jgi:hypothetical protein